ncbi:hypothetical protein BACT_1077 [Bifidobacterium actinocoloniiforme DSM 22766]|uniref:Terminase small subunit actinomycetes phage-type domain-containing protein n=1 Tax=Bifidobacterium actinocoloniiforme DSM 22766 TaxID=1437605 RepID=A0A086Z1H5_9BIFI|nr:hypothetical protein [Bifidobacterium actinocoloniiforme]AKV55515.1 hypothetical protein AB656_04010 [Bifidobacterium actinocoloniiforme DSM 22766]KFI40375.1 hypothetical protein BACT_1077 [Bifidobacterium actinocoloniiforme DSM 22766]
MAAKFELLNVSDALERSIKNSSGQLTAKHSALVSAARVLARRIDMLCEAGFENEDGKIDNVTIPTFLKYLQALGLTAETVKAEERKPRKVSVDDLTAFRQRHKA